MTGNEFVMRRITQKDMFRILHNEKIINGSTEAELLDIIGTNVLRTSLLANHSHLY
jgi:hypothetical protein